MYANWAYRNVGEVRSWLTAMPAWQHFKTEIAACNIGAGGYT